MRSGRSRRVDVDGGPPPASAAEAMNTMLPDDLAVTAAAEVAADFHARHSARARTYRYRIWRRRTPLAVRAAAQLVDAAADR